MENLLKDTSIDGKPAERKGNSVEPYMTEKGCHIDRLVSLLMKFPLANDKDKGLCVQKNVYLALYFSKNQKWNEVELLLQEIIERPLSFGKRAKLCKHILRDINKLVLDSADEKKATLVDLLRQLEETPVPTTV